MKFVNPELGNVTLLKSLHYVVTERLREIVCDKYGIEGDCTIEEMFDEIYAMIISLEIS